ncbi:glucose-6-phosphate isomerase [Lentisalinibacter salinarum]|uniref:glucose-6-phosphate isomerase n=1 Tax=Lentisalinibacter salinarum TaxID=2992239 RepID=UPI00386FECCD
MADPRKLSARYPTDLPAWRRLKDHRKKLRDTHLVELFRKDKRRANRFSVEAGDLLLDYSKNLITAETLKLLTALAREAGVPKLRNAMFAGQHINRTEDRAVLHAALRAPRDEAYRDGEQDASHDVHEVLEQMAAFVDGVHAGGIRGSGGQRFTDVVNIGIGGSDLGIVMAATALHHHRVKSIRLHCVSNIDGTQLADLTETLDPATTLFVVCSKTFTTLETVTNAKAARRWVAEQLGEEAVPDHFAAASTNHEAMDAFGLHPDYRFAFWDWVGGRYSLWSAVGLSIALAIGTDNFRELLAGGHAMDRHFREDKLGENMPVILALLAVWYNNFFDAETQAILPYDNRLERFPAFLQQLQMESNGKRVRIDGKPARCATGMVIWGEAGSNAQHSFYQLLHQGTRFIPVDFLLPAKSSGGSQHQQDLAIANCLAQAEALMEGQSEDDVRADLEAKGLDSDEIEALVPHKVHPGNRPSNLILFEALTPRALGQLVALYEHKVFVESVIWGINAFDQWGVELGKKLATGLVPAVENPSRYEGENRSTRALLERIKKM